ncbi:hypothetical protein ACTXT7_001804 [Hymenolepis weldensis]
MSAAFCYRKSTASTGLLDPFSNLEKPVLLTIKEIPKLLNIAFQLILEEVYATCEDSKVRPLSSSSRSQLSRFLWDCTANDK